MRVMSVRWMCRRVISYEFRVASNAFRIHRFSNLILEKREESTLELFSLLAKVDFRNEI